MTPARRRFIRRFLCCAAAISAGWYTGAVLWDTFVSPETGNYFVTDGVLAVLTGVPLGLFMAIALDRRSRPAEGTQR